MSPTTRRTLLKTLAGAGAATAISGFPFVNRLALGQPGDAPHLLVRGHGKAADGEGEDEAEVQVGEQRRSPPGAYHSAAAGGQWTAAPRA